MLDVVLGRSHGVIMIEEIACGLVVGHMHDLDIPVEQTVRHLEEGLRVVELLEVFRVVEGVIAYSEVASVVEPTQRIAVINWTVG